MVTLSSDAGVGALLQAVSSSGSTKSAAKIRARFIWGSPFKSASFCGLMIPPNAEIHLKRNF
jgi:hypothetical protein